MKIILSSTFEKMIKKLHTNQKSDLDDAVRVIVNNPTIGEQKSGDLAGVLVYKFKMQKQQILLSYLYDGEDIILTLLSIGSHENFYTNLKKQIKS